MTGDLFLDAEADVRRYRLVSEHLRAVADSPDVSRSLIAALAEQVCGAGSYGMNEPDLSRSQWRKSSRSSANGQCVEVNLRGEICRSARLQGSGRPQAVLYSERVASVR